MADTVGIAAAQLKSVVERIERLEEEKKALSHDIKDVYAEAKANGFDTKTIRTVVRLRKMDRADREEAEALLDLYLNALGMAPAGEGDEPTADKGGDTTVTLSVPGMAPVTATLDQFSAAARIVSGAGARR